MRRALAGALSGALLALSLPPFGYWPLALLGAGVLALACQEARGRARLFAGFLAGITQFGIGLWWTNGFSVVGFVVLVVVEALFLAFACALTPARRGSLAGFVGLVTLFEWARESWPLGGLPLGGIALGETGGPLLGTARLGGPLLVVAVTVLLGAGLAGLVRRRRRIGGIVAVTVAVALALLATIAPNGGPATGSIRAAIVQEGGRRGLDALQVPAKTVLERVLRTTRPLKSRDVQLVLWPEDVVELDGPVDSSAAIHTVQRLARRLSATLLAGVTDPVGTTLFDNEILAFSPSGRIVARFEKVHPVPFGEYVPYRAFVAHFANLSDIPRDAIVGHGSGMVETPAGRFALLVSYETFFTDRGRAGVRAGGRLLLVSTNTASYASTQVPSEELAASRIQAVAEGRNLLQSATTGVSAAIDPEGRVLARTRLGVRAVLVVTAPLRKGATIYDTTGQWPVLAFSGILAIFGLVAGLLERRQRKAQPPSPTS